MLDCAQAVRRQIAAGDSLVLDESDDSLALASLLADFRGLSVLTNGMRTARTLLENPHLDVTVIPGQIDRASRSVLAAPSVARLLSRARLGYFGAASFSPEHGLMEASPGLAETKKFLAGLCDVRFAAVAVSGVGHFGPYVFAETQHMSDIYFHSG